MPPRYIPVSQSQGTPRFLPFPGTGTPSFGGTPRFTPSLATPSPTGAQDAGLGLGLAKGATQLFGLGNQALGGPASLGSAASGALGALDLGVGALNLSQNKIAPGVLSALSGAGKLAGAAFPSATLGSVGIGEAGGALGNLPIGTALGSVAGMGSGAFNAVQGFSNENPTQGIGGIAGTVGSLALLLGAPQIGIPLAIISAALGLGGGLAGGPTFAQRQKIVQGVNKGDLQQVGQGLGSLGAVASEATSPEELQFLNENNKLFFPNLDTGSAMKMATGGANVAALRNSRAAQLLTDQQSRLPQLTRFALTDMALSPEELEVQKANPAEMGYDPLFWIQPEHTAQWRKEFNVPGEQRFGFDALRQLHERDRVREILSQQQTEARLNALGGSLRSPALSGGGGSYEGRYFSNLDDYIAFLEQDRARQYQPDH